MATTRSLRSGKKQTRLQFQPLSSSSPIKGAYSDAVQDRLAKVRYEGAKRNLTIPVLAEDKRESLPTPQPSSPTGAGASCESSLRLSDMRLTRRSVLKTSSPLSSLRTSPAVPPRFIDIGYDTSSDDDDEIVLPSTKRRKLSTSDTKPLESRKALVSTPTRRSSRLTSNKSSPPMSSSSTVSQHAVSVDVPLMPRLLSNIGSAETSDDDVMATRPTTRKKGRQQAVREDPFVVEDHEMEMTHQRSKRSNKQDDFVVGNDEVEFISSSEESTGHGEPSKRKHTPKKGSPKSAQKRSKKRSKKMQEELAEDLLDLQDSEQELSHETSRTRGGPVTTQRDKTRQHFDLLKKRRARNKQHRVLDSDESDEALNSEHDGAEISNVDKAHNRIEIPSDDSASIHDESEILEEQVWTHDDEIDDFVVEDRTTTGRLGRPNTDIPLQFTSFASAKPRELFPHIIEWMVKNKISPAFNRHDDLYNLSFSRVDDQVKAQAGSRLISSAWNATFKNAILARPNIKVTGLPGLDEELIRTCDACNKSNHPARYEFTFSGKPYYKDSLEPVDDSDEDSDDDAPLDDQISRDEQGHVLASERMRFYLGRFCAANAEMGHKLTHWKHHLNDQVLLYLEEQGVLSVEAIVQREKINKKKREREAETIVDSMQETGMIAELWQSFKDDLEDARIGMEGHERKGGRSKARIGSVRVRREDGVLGEWADGGKFRQIATRLESDSEGE